MYDFANQSFTLLIITLLFSLFVKQAVTPWPPMTDAQAERIALIESGEASLDPGAEPEIATLLEERRAADRAGSWNWSLMHGTGLLLVVLASPVVGALADSRGLRKQLLIGTGVLCCALTCSLAGIGPGMLTLAALLYIPANICYQLGENMLASFLPQIAERRNLGRISAIGWTMGYAGALALLIIVFIAIKLTGRDDPPQWRPFFIFAGLWFAIGMLPSVFLLRDDPPDRTISRNLVAESLGRVRDTLRHASRYRDLVLFLTAFFVYALGVQTVIAFASILAERFGIVGNQLVVFVLQITLTAGLASIATARFQDRIGARATVLIYLAVWILSCAGLLAMTFVPRVPTAWFWIVGNGLGFALGGIGTSSRSMVARFTPRHRTAEFFGLWGMAYKLAGAIGVLSFGAVTRLLGHEASSILLTSFFIAGFFLVLPVRELRGYRVARRAERDHARRPAADTIRP